MGTRAAAKETEPAQAENLAAGSGQGDEKLGLRRRKGNSLKGQSKGGNKKGNSFRGRDGNTVWLKRWKGQDFLCRIALIRRGGRSENDFDV